MINVEGLTVSFNGFVAVDHISFNVKPGEVVGILGANGAGKSTTMKSLAGIIRPQQGYIKVDNHTLTNVKEEEAAKMLLGYCPDVGGLVVGATPREHIQLLLSLHGRPDDYDTGLFLVEKIGLQEFIDTPVGGFSHGMSRRLSVVLATLASSKVLILDEPFDGVDPVGVDAIEAIIQEAKKAGLAVVVSTHLQNVLTRVTDRIIVMRKGVILARLESEELSGDKGENLYKKMLADADEQDQEYEDVILERHLDVKIETEKKKRSWRLQRKDRTLMPVQEYEEELSPQADAPEVIAEEPKLEVDTIDMKNEEPQAKNIEELPPLAEESQVTPKAEETSEEPNVERDGK